MLRWLSRWLAVWAFITWCVPIPGSQAAAPDSAHATPVGAPGTAPVTSRAAPTDPSVVVLETVAGIVVIRCYDADAPLTSANFRKLARSRYYDGTYFHRVMPGFMIQGGDPNSRTNRDPADDGMGGPGYTIPAEIKRQNVRGAVAAARLANAANPQRESNGSQFFILLKDQPSLDADGYTVFGEVITGMAVVDTLAIAGTGNNLPAAAGGGRNLGALGMIRHASVMPLSESRRLAAPATTAKPAR